jgi:hypothetical protein
MPLGAGNKSVKNQIQLMNEQEIFRNSFGSVTDKSITITTKGRVESIPIKQVSSVSFDRRRNKIMATCYFLAVLIVWFFTLKLGTIKLGVVVLISTLSILFPLIGIAYFIGNHVIRMNVAGKEIKPIKVEMSKTSEGQAFFQAIRKQIV